MIYVMGPKDKTPSGAIRVDVTSRAKSAFSPFLNPCTEPIKAKNMENAWQYSKVYKEHDRGGKPSSEWYAWNKKGLQSNWAERYPMGKNAVPEYSWFNDQALDYIEARKQLYVPLYRSMVSKLTHELAQLIYLADEDDIALWDFDGYNEPDKTWEEIINDPDKKMGHAFVLRQIILEQT